MTSSLVGSEMCIRDSSKGWWLFAAALFCKVTAKIPPEGPSPSVAGYAVSYTHLTLPTICSV
eukprot:5454720-Prorocentrum_lima.AAC.1